MDRRRFVAGAVGGLLAEPHLSKAQQPGRVYRIGYLSAPTRESVEHVLQAFLRALHELGWVEGRNLIIEYRWADGRAERLPALAAELVQRKVDLIVAPADSAALAAKAATSSIPIVMTLPLDPVKSKLVVSLARPGGNITGTTFTPSTDVFGKLLGLLKEAFPPASHVAILANPPDSSDTSLRLFKELQAAAQSLRMRLHRLNPRGPEELDSAFAAMAREQVDSLLVVGSFLPHRTKLADLSAKHLLPTMYGLREYVTAGGLMSYGLNMAEFVGRTAVYVDKILKGANPAEMAIEQPTKFELVINMKAAKALGITIPRALLLRADEVIA